MPHARVLPTLYRDPTLWLTRAREDHAICLSLAADYRRGVARGDTFLRERHAWALAHARTLRARFPGLLSEPCIGA